MPLVRSVISEMEGFARSARTQRPRTRRRLVRRRIRDGIIGKLNLKEYRVESVGHDASPSCRDCSQQVLRVSMNSRIGTCRRPAAAVRPVCTNSSAGSAAAVAGSPSRCLLRVSHLRLHASEARMPRLETLDKRLPFPYRYEFRTDNRLVKRRQRAHRRRFARSPRFQNRAGLKIVGAANDLRNTRCRKTRNAFDSPSRRLNLHLR